MTVDAARFLYYGSVGAVDCQGAVLHRRSFRAPLGSEPIPLSKFQGGMTCSCVQKCVGNGLGEAKISRLTLDCARDAFGKALLQQEEDDHGRQGAEQHREHQHAIIGHIACDQIGG